MQRRSRDSKKARVAGPGKGIYKPGKVWVRKSDGVEFILREKDELGLLFVGHTGHFVESMFRPK